MDILNKKQKIIIIIIVIFMLLFIGYYTIKKADNDIYMNLETHENQVVESVMQNEKTEEKEEIIVHITGAVENEGIVVIENGSRISDVIEEAGGTTQQADLSKINLAYAVSDGQKIYVPSTNDEEKIETIKEDSGENVIEESSVSIKSEKVNINTANQTELETLNGIGPSTALKIINYREQNGKFQSIEDVKNVPGIGEAKYDGIKEDICI